MKKYKTHSPFERRSLHSNADKVAFRGREISTALHVTKKKLVTVSRWLPSVPVSLGLHENNFLVPGSAFNSALFRKWKKKNSNRTKQTKTLTIGKRDLFPPGNTNLQYESPYKTTSQGGIRDITLRDSNFVTPSKIQTLALWPFWCVRKQPNPVQWRQFQF